MLNTPDLLRLITTVFIAVTCVVIGDTAGKLLTVGGVDPIIVAWSRFLLAALMLLPFSGLTSRELPALLQVRVLLPEQELLQQELKNRRALQPEHRMLYRLL